MQSSPLSSSPPSNLPSWQTLQTQLTGAKKPWNRHAVGIGGDDLAEAPTNPHSCLRSFGSKEEPRVTLYRDNSAWCPYCQKVWLLLEEKRIPYRVKKVRMRAYGKKEAWYLKIVPSGMLPALELDGKLYTESNTIQQVLENEFAKSYKQMLPDVGTQKLEVAKTLFRLERNLFGVWLRYLVGSRYYDVAKENFEDALDNVDEALKRYDGPYFLGEKVSMIDCVFVPFLERMAASIPYAKGWDIRKSKWKVRMRVSGEIKEYAHCKRKKNMRLVI
mmetsp:Transcript_943/g.2114  ORF Transcript_943/g.2114 Transcript_943/m.2114 type:complete len:274 (-) Transcript_943:754-1575(-)